MQISYRNLIDNGAREMVFDSFGGRNNCDYNRVSLADISEIFVKQDDFF